MQEIVDPGRGHNVVISAYRETTQDNVQLQVHGPERKLLVGNILFTMTEQIGLIDPLVTFCNHIPLKAKISPQLY